MALYQLDGFTPRLENDDAIWIAESSEVIGKVALGAKTSIWFGAILRGDNEWITIGEGSNAQESSIFHTDIGSPVLVGKNCTIGHRALVHGTTIGDNCLIGMGAIVMSRSVIGSHSIVGAGALVTEDKIFPEYSLILGSPARFVRRLSDEEVQKNTETALRYQANALRFKKGMTRI